MLNNHRDITICHLTSVHQSTDVRIFYKECIALTEKGYSVYLVVAETESRKEKGVQIIGVSCHAQTRLGRMLKTVNAICRKAIEIDADIYHLHDPELLRIVAKLKRLGKKVIYDAHEDLPRQIMSKEWINQHIRMAVSWLAEKYEDNKVKNLDMIVAATPYIQERFKKINHKCVNINNFPIYEENRRNCLTNKSRNAICYVGGISRIRGIIEVIEALSLMKTDAVLHLVGAFDDMKLEQKMRRCSGWAKVKYYGMLERHEAYRVMSLSLAGIVTFLPYPNHVNAQPNKMFEYMSSGLAVVASNFPLWESIIEEAQCGICVDPESPESIAGALDDLVLNKEKARLFGENGKKSVLKKYNWHQESIKLLKAYDEIVLHE